MSHINTERLRQARRQAKLTQDEAAERAGVNRNTISGYETGRVRPSALALNMLATVYGMSVSWFFGEDTTDTSPDPRTPSGDDIDIADPELRLFFRGEWDEFAEEEQEFIKGMIRESRELLRKRREADSA